MSYLEPDFLLTSLDDIQQSQRSLLFTSLASSEFKRLQPSNEFAWVVRIGSHGQAERVLPENPALVQEAARGADHCAIINTPKEATIPLDKFFTGGEQNRAIRFTFDFNLRVNDPLRFYNFVQGLHQRQVLEGNFYELRIRDLLNYLLGNAHQLFKAQVNSYDPDFLLHDNAVQYQLMQLYINCLPVDELEQAGLELDYRSVCITVKDLAERDAQKLKEFEHKRQYYETRQELMGGQPLEPTLVETPAIDSNIAAGKPQSPAVRLALYALAIIGIALVIVGFIVTGPAQIIALVVGFLLIITGAGLTYFSQRQPATHAISAATVYPPLPGNLTQSSLVQLPFIQPPAQPQPVPQGRSFRLRVEEGLTPGGNQVLNLSGPGAVIAVGIREHNSPVLYFWNENVPEQVWNFPGLDAASLEGVSRVHAHFRLVDNLIWLCSGSPDGNQGARNGTFINGEKLEHGSVKGRPVKPNDLIGLGPRASGINAAYNRAGGVTISFEPL